MSETCPRVGKWFRGCRFEGRYDQEPGGAMDVKGDTAFTIAAMKAAKLTIYVRDVCVTCGRVIERQVLDEQENAA